MLFFIALLLLAQKASSSRVIDGKPPLKKLPGQTAQGHIGIIRDTLKNPALVLSRLTIRPVPAHFAWCGASVRRRYADLIMLDTLISRTAAAVRALSPAAIRAIARSRRYIG
jgi:hypothetical protein